MNRAWVVDIARNKIWIRAVYVEWCGIQPSGSVREKESLERICSPAGAEGKTAAAINSGRKNGCSEVDSVSEASRIFLTKGNHSVAVNAGGAVVLEALLVADVEIVGVSLCGMRPIENEEASKK